MDRHAAAEAQTRRGLEESVRLLDEQVEKKRREAQRRNIAQRKMTDIVR